MSSTRQRMCKYCGSYFLSFSRVNKTCDKCNIENCVSEKRIMFRLLCVECGDEYREHSDKITHSQCVKCRFVSDDFKNRLKVLSKEKNM